MLAIRTLRGLLVSLCLCVPCTTSIAQDAAPSAPKAPAKKPAVYDEAADGKAQIEQALARAGKENRRVLIQWGANWCGWCIRLHELTSTDQAVKRQLSYEYDLVHIDVGQFNKHMDLAAKYGADLKAHGLPFLTILDATGKPLANQETSSLELPQGQIKGTIAHDSAKVLSFLKQHQATPLRAESVLASSLSIAKKDGKAVFLHFGAPWCGWCHRLEGWMVKPEIATILARDFVDCKIDQDRMTGGLELFGTYNKTPGGIPWFVFLDADGKPIIDSTDPKDGNVGFPAAPGEIAHFGTMLQKARKNLTDSDIATLLESLKPVPVAKPASK